MSRTTKIRNVILATLGTLVGLAVALYLYVFLLWAVPIYLLDKADVIGGYIGEYDVSPKPEPFYQEGKHYLELRADDSYIYIYTPRNGSKVTLEGEWEFDGSGLQAHILLDNFTFAPSPGVDSHGSYGTCLILIAHRRLAINVDDDLGFYLVKQNQ